MSGSLWGHFLPWNPCEGALTSGRWETLNTVKIKLKIFVFVLVARLDSRFRAIARLETIVGAESAKIYKNPLLSANFSPKIMFDPKKRLYRSRAIQWCYWFRDPWSFMESPSLRLRAFRAEENSGDMSDPKWDFSTVLNTNVMSANNFSYLCKLILTTPSRSLLPRATWLTLA